MGRDPGGFGRTGKKHKRVSQFDIHRKPKVPCGDDAQAQAAAGAASNDTEMEEAREHPGAAVEAGDVPQPESQPPAEPPALPPQPQPQPVPREQPPPPSPAQPPAIAPGEAAASGPAAKATAPRTARAKSLHPRVQATRERARVSMNDYIKLLEGQQAAARAEAREARVEARTARIEVSAARVQGINDAVRIGRLERALEAQPLQMAHVEAIAAAMRACDRLETEASCREVVWQMWQQAREAGIEFYFEDTVDGWRVTRDPPRPPEDTVVCAAVAHCLDDCVTAIEHAELGVAGMAACVLRAQSA